MLSNIVAYEEPFSETKQVACISGDGHIHEMVTGQKGRWSDADVSELAGVPALALETAIMTGYAWSAGLTRQIAYVSPVEGNGHIHELVVRQGGMWSYADLMDQLPAAPTADGVALTGKRMGPNTCCTRGATAIFMNSCREHRVSGFIAI